MQTGAEIAYHHMDPSPGGERRVGERLSRLEKHFGRLTRCRVIVDAPHLAHRKGNHHTVRLEAQMPGAVFTVDRAPGDANAHEEVLVAVRDAFDALERQGRRWKETHSGRPEGKAERLQGRIAELRPAENHGQIGLADGRLVSFHRNSLVDADFDALTPGDTVEIALDAGDSAKGPHASTVHLISGRRFVDRPG